VDGGTVSISQVEELRTVEPWSQEHGFRAFARKHGLKVGHVYYIRRKLGLPMVYLPRWNRAPAADVNEPGLVARSTSELPDVLAREGIEPTTSPLIKS
jgi:hypothetical protein